MKKLMKLWKRLEGVLQGLGILCCVTVPVCYGIAAFCATNIHWRFAGFSCIEVFAVSCLVMALLIGHVLVYAFWRTFRARKKDDEPSAQDNAHKPIGSNELARIQEFLEKTFGGSLRIIADCHFPNGFRADAVAVRGRGKYPMMCLEVIDGEDSPRKIEDAVRELYHAYSSRVPFMRCFVITVGVAGMAMWASAGVVSNVNVSNRYPWNGMVDIAFTITGDAGTAYRTTFAAKDVAGGTNLVMETVWEDGKAAASSRPSYLLKPGNYRFVWNAGADLPDGAKLERVAITVEAK